MVSPFVINFIGQNSIIPNIFVFYESKQGQREFAEWKERREVEKQEAKTE